MAPLLKYRYRWDRHSLAGTDMNMLRTSHKWQGPNSFKG